MREIYAFLGGFGHFWTLWAVHGRIPFAQSKVGPIQVRPWADLDAIRMSMDGFWRGLRASTKAQLVGSVTYIECVLLSYLMLQIFNVFGKRAAHVSPTKSRKHNFGVC